MDAKVERPMLVGNRWVLVGAVLYLLEWVAIVAAGVDAPFGADSGVREVTDAYASNVGSWGIGVLLWRRTPRRQTVAEGTA